MGWLMGWGEGGFVRCVTGCLWITGATRRSACGWLGFATGGRPGLAVWGLKVGDAE